MPRSSDKTVAAILDASFLLFFRRGYARVSMNDIAAAAGVTKRTLYYHYPSKDALVGAALDKQNQLSLAAFQKWAAPEAASTDDFVVHLFDQLAKWSMTPSWTGSGFTRLSMELGDLPGHPARKASQRHKRALQHWLSEELSNRGHEGSNEAAAKIVVALEGATTLSFIHSDPEYFVIAAEIARHAVSPRA
ncbi:TetR/AcrR family transcriptional regulator [uncultured Hoeflea sp.]|uniref:TetR/AcrR family transcriptional regulator n=1 Tax=uncultured Hoeflea sp. TaxID=538666 RepID=UPI00262764BF|nr:TetR/AcrR family transcriptional regulator [uncultured Hoeflea sp.]